MVNVLLNFSREYKIMSGTNKCVSIVGFRKATASNDRNSGEQKDVIPVEGKTSLPTKEFLCKKETLGERKEMETKTSPTTKIRPVEIERKSPERKIDFSYPEEDYSDINDIPEFIEITYKTDVNILIIHKAIRKLFGCERSRLGEYKRQITEISTALQCDLSRNDARRFIKRRDSLIKKVQDITEETKWLQYIKLAQPFLEKYCTLTLDRPRATVLVGRKGDKSENKGEIEARIAAIEGYIKIASYYLIINVSRIEKLVATCPVCEAEFKDFEVDEDAGICTCSCGWFRENLAKTSCNKDSGRTSSNSKNDYEDRENFYKAAMRFACKQLKTFHPKLEEDLDEYFIGIGIGPGEQIRTQPVVNGRKKGVNFQKMIKALTTLSKSRNINHSYRKIYSDYYEDAWLIMHDYWGLPANNIVPLISDLMEIYDKTQKIYNSLTPAERGGREASLNTQYRLLVELLALGFACTKADFKIPGQKESLDNHQRLWKIMCVRTGTKYCAII